MATLSLPAPPVALRFAPDGAGLYAALAIDTGGSVVALVPRAGGAVRLSPPLAGTAVDLGLARDSRTLYLALSGAGGGVSFLDLAALRERRRLEVCDTALALAATRDGERLYLLCGGDRIAEIDPGLEIVVRIQRFASACHAARLALSGTEGLLLVPCSAGGRLLYLDRRTLAPLDSLTLEPGLHGIAVARGGRAVVTVPAANRVLVADLRARTLVHDMGMLEQLSGVAVDAAGRGVYVLTRSALLMLDLETGTIPRRAALTRGASGLAVWPGPREPRPAWYLTLRASAPISELPALDAVWAARAAAPAAPGSPDSSTGQPETPASHGPASRP